MINFSHELLREAYIYPWLKEYLKNRQDLNNNLTQSLSPDKLINLIKKIDPCCMTEYKRTSPTSMSIVFKHPLDRSTIDRVLYEIKKMIGS